MEIVTLRWIFFLPLLGGVNAVVQFWFAIITHNISTYINIAFDVATTNIHTNAHQHSCHSLQQKTVKKTTVYYLTRLYLKQRVSGLPSTLYRQFELMCYSTRNRQSYHLWQPRLCCTSSVFDQIDG